MQLLPNKDNPLYTIITIGVATFLIGPVVAVYMLYSNFKNLHQERAARNTLMIGVLIILILLGLFYYASPEQMAKIPNSVYNISFMAIATAIAIYYQGEVIKKHLESGGKKASLLKTIGVSLIALIITIGLILPALLPGLFAEPFTGEKYSFGITNNAIYYEGDIDTVTLDEVSKALTDFGYFDDTQQSFMKIEKKDNEYLLYLPVLPEFWEDKNVINTYIEIKEGLQDEIFNQPIKIFFWGIVDGNINQSEI